MFKQYHYLNPKLNNFNEVSKRKIKYNINSTWNESSVLERQQVLFNQQNNIMKGQNNLIQLMYSNKSNWYWVISYIDAKVGNIQVQCNVFCFISFDIVCFKSAILCLYGFKLYAWDPQRISTMFLPAGDFLEIDRSWGKFA